MLQNPENIYQELEISTNKIFNEILNFSDSSKNISAIKNEIYAFVNNVKQKITEASEDLKKNSDWNVFTIAFYGETNAGKSTIIEVLRIFLNERTKLEEIKKYKQFQKENGITAIDLDKIEDDIAFNKKKLDEIDLEKAKIENSYKEIEEEFNKKLNDLKSIIQIKKSKLSLVRKIFNFLLFKKLKEEYEYKSFKKEFTHLIMNKNKELNLCNNKFTQIESKYNSLFSKKQKLLKKMEELINLQDGKIIGDGRSDFTKKNHIYEFNYDGYQFNLIDIPGIEGNEKNVNKVIWEAVKKAHAVFYVTNKAARPQTGDKYQKGTIEKIQEHLGRQTEIWSVFNQSVTNPRRLAVPLVNEDEQKSLNDLDASMRGLFGNRYCGHICLSALPAFLSISECLSAPSEKYKQQKKFYSQFSKDEIFKFSNIKLFKKKLEDISLDFPNKIRKANFYKVSCVLKDVSDEIELLIHNQIEPACKKIENDEKNTENQIDILVQQFKKDIKNNSNKCIKKFENIVQEKSYDYINLDVSNKDFKSKFQEYVKEEQKKLLDELEQTIKTDINKFSKGLKEIISNFQMRLNEFFSLRKQNKSNNTTDFNLDFKVNNIDIAGITTTIISLGAAIGAILAAASGGIAVIVGAVLATLSFIISAAKTIWGLINSNYKKSQQRKKVDENLSKIKKNMTEHINKHIEDMFRKEINENIRKIKEDLIIPVKQIYKIKVIMVDTKNNLNQLRSNSEIFKDIAI